MVKVDEAFEIRYKFCGNNFEVLVDFEKLNEFKKNPEKISVYDVLADDKIFSDQKKGEVASTNILNTVFDNKSEEEILKQILIKGECQIPTAYLNKLRSERKEQIISYIVENATNPQTKGKFSRTMIESEFNKLRVNININTDIKSQAEDVIKSLRKVMPISCEKIILEICVSGEFCGNFYGPFRKFGKITKEYFDDLGEMHIHIEIFESQIDEVANFIKKNTKESGTYFVSKN